MLDKLRIEQSGPRSATTYLKTSLVLPKIISGSPQVPWILLRTAWYSREFTGRSKNSDWLVQFSD